MIEEAYVSFEIAKLLKEKGFNEECKRRYYYNGDLSRVDSMVYMNSHRDMGDKYTAPTHQMAMRWLRETKKLFIQIMLDSWCLDSHSGYYVVIQATDSDFEEVSPTEQIFYETYEEAAEAGILYCLENLI